MDDTIDLLQIKIENAKRQLSEDTLNAIAAVPWQAEILKMRETKGYSFEQLEDLELETELLLCGLLSPENYPKELENRMKISQAQANVLVKEMNELVFAKIKEELVKSTERKKIFVPTPPTVPPEGVGEEEKKHDEQVLSEHGIDIIPEKLEINSPLEEYSTPKAEGGGLSTPSRERATPQEGNIHPILAQKLSGSFQIPTVKTEHTLENITKTNQPANTPVPETPKASYPPKADPYRINPE